MVWKPDVTVAAVIERDARFLLVEERIRGRLVFNQPAGHVEDGESLLEAVVRETLEETAWELTPGALLGVYQWRSPRGPLHLALRLLRHRGPAACRAAARSAGDRYPLAHAQRDRGTRAARCARPLVLRCIDDYLRGVRLPLDAR